MVGTPIRRGCLCSRISTITIRFGGEWLRRVLTYTRRFDDKHSGEGPSQQTEAPIIYTFLQEWHLDQVHDLLTRSFWSGIDSVFLESTVLFPTNKK